MESPIVSIVGGGRGQRRDEGKAGTVDIAEQRSKVIDQIEKLKAKFDEADEQGEDGLEPEPFVEALSEVLYDGRCNARIVKKLQQMFMKIDANSDGSVDWDEFTNFMLNEQADHGFGKGEDVAQVVLSAPKRDARVSWDHMRLYRHVRPVNKALMIPGPSQGNDNSLSAATDAGEFARNHPVYVTGGADGMIKFWDAARLHCLCALDVDDALSQPRRSRNSRRSASNRLGPPGLPRSGAGRRSLDSSHVTSKKSRAWVADLTYLPLSGYLAAACTDRSVQFFDARKVLADHKTPLPLRARENKCGTGESKVPYARVGELDDDIRVGGRRRRATHGMRKGKKKGSVRMRSVSHFSSMYATSSQGYRASRLRQRGADAPLPHNPLCVDGAVVGEIRDAEFLFMGDEHGNLTTFRLPVATRGGVEGNAGYTVGESKDGGNVTGGSGGGAGGGSGGAAPSGTGGSNATALPHWHICDRRPGIYNCQHWREQGTSSSSYSDVSGAEADRLSIKSGVGMGLKGVYVSPGVSISCIPRLHSDWMTHVRYERWLGNVVTAGLDGVVHLLDTNRVIPRARRQSRGTFDGSGGDQCRIGASPTVHLSRSFCVKRSYTMHARGVYCAAYSENMKLMASGGVDRCVHLWEPNQMKTVHVLPDHTSSVVDVQFAEDLPLLFTVSQDSVVKIFDVRTYKMVQSIGDTKLAGAHHIRSLLIDDGMWRSKLNPFLSKSALDSGAAEASSFSDERNGGLGRLGRVLACGSSMHVYDVHRMYATGPSSHDSALVDALYNEHFHQIVSADRSGVVCVWDVDTGERVSGFLSNLGGEDGNDTAVDEESTATAGAGAEGRADAQAAHGVKNADDSDDSGGEGVSEEAVSQPNVSSGHRSDALTAICFDHGKRRLLTAHHDGTLRMFNFSNGQFLMFFKTGSSEQGEGGGSDNAPTNASSEPSNESKQTANTTNTTNTALTATRPPSFAVSHENSPLSRAGQDPHIALPGTLLSRVADPASALPACPPAASYVLPHWHAQEGPESSSFFQYMFERKGGEVETPAVGEPSKSADTFGLFGKIPFLGGFIGPDGRMLSRQAVESAEKQASQSVLKQQTAAEAPLIMKLGVHVKTAGNVRQRKEITSLVYMQETGDSDELNDLGEGGTAGGDLLLMEEFLGAADASEMRNAPKYVLAAGWERRINVWRESPERVLQEVLFAMPYRQYLHTGHTDDILCMCVCGAKHIIATGSADGRILLWHFDSPQAFACLLPRPDHLQRTPREKLNVESLLWLPKRNLLLSGHADGFLRLWDVKLHTMLWEHWNGHAPCAVTSYALGFSKKTVKFLREDRMMRYLLVDAGLYDKAMSLEDSEGSGQFFLSKKVEFVRYVVTGDSGGHVRVWDLSGLSAEALRKRKGLPLSVKDPNAGSANGSTAGTPRNNPSLSWLPSMNQLGTTQGRDAGVSDAQVVEADEMVAVDENGDPLRNAVVTSDGAGMMVTTGEEPGESRSNTALSSFDLVHCHTGLPFVSLLYWRAHRCVVNCVHFVPGRGLVVTGGADGKLVLWTLDNCVCVGMFGQSNRVADCWRLNDPSTYYDNRLARYRAVQTRSTGSRNILSDLIKSATGRRSGDGSTASSRRVSARTHSERVDSDAESPAHQDGRVVAPDGTRRFAMSAEQRELVPHSDLLKTVQSIHHSMSELAAKLPGAKSHTQVHSSRGPGSGDSPESGFVATPQNADSDNCISLLLKTVRTPSAAHEAVPSSPSLVSTARHVLPTEFRSSNASDNGLGVPVVGRPSPHPFRSTQQQQQQQQQPHPQKQQKTPQQPMEPAESTSPVEPSGGAGAGDASPSSPSKSPSSESAQQPSLVAGSAIGDIPVDETAVGGDQAGFSFVGLGVILPPEARVPAHAPMPVPSFHVGSSPLTQLFRHLEASNTSSLDLAVTEGKSGSPRRRNRHSAEQFDQTLRSVTKELRVSRAGGRQAGLSHQLRAAEEKRQAQAERKRHALRSPSMSALLSSLSVQAHEQTTSSNASQAGDMSLDLGPSARNNNNNTVRVRTTDLDISGPPTAPFSPQSSRLSRLTGQSRAEGKKKTAAGPSILSRRARGDSSTRSLGGMLGGVVGGGVASSSSSSPYPRRREMEEWRVEALGLGKAKSSSATSSDGLVQGANGIWRRPNLKYATLKPVPFCGTLRHQETMLQNDYLKRMLRGNSNYSTRRTRRKS